MSRVSNKVYVECLFDPHIIETLQARINKEYEGSRKPIIESITPMFQEIHDGAYDPDLYNNGPTNRRDLYVKLTSKLQEKQYNANKENTLFVKFTDDYNINNINDTDSSSSNKSKVISLNILDHSSSIDIDTYKVYIINEFQKIENELERQRIDSEKTAIESRPYSKLVFYKRSKEAFSVVDDLNYTKEMQFIRSKRYKILEECFHEFMEEHKTKFVDKTNLFVTPEYISNTSTKSLYKETQDIYKDQPSLSIDFSDSNKINEITKKSFIAFSLYVLQIVFRIHILNKKNVLISKIDALPNSVKEMIEKATIRYTLEHEDLKDRISMYYDKKLDLKQISKNMNNTTKLPSHEIIVFINPSHNSKLSQFEYKLPLTIKNLRQEGSSFLVEFERTVKKYKKTWMIMDVENTEPPFNVNIFFEASAEEKYTPFTIRGLLYRSPRKGNNTDTESELYFNNIEPTKGNSFIFYYIPHFEITKDSVLQYLEFMEKSTSKYKTELIDILKSKESLYGFYKYCQKYFTFLTKSGNGHISMVNTLLEKGDCFFLNTNETSRKCKYSISHIEMKPENDYVGGTNEANEAEFEEYEDEGTDAKLENFYQSLKNLLKPITVYYRRNSRITHKLTKNVIDLIENELYTSGSNDNIAYTDQIKRLNDIIVHKYQNDDTDIEAEKEKIRELITNIETTFVRILNKQKQESDFEDDSKAYRELSSDTKKIFIGLLERELYNSLDQEQPNINDSNSNVEEKSQGVKTTKKITNIHIVIHLQNKQKPKQKIDEILEYDCNARYKRILEGVRSFSKKVSQKLAIETAKRSLGGQKQTRKQRDKRKTKYKKRINIRKKRNKNTRKTK